MNIKKILSKDVLCVLGDRNSGKSMFLYDLVANLCETSTPVWCFGLDKGIVAQLKANPLYSLKELENLTDCFVVIDEFITLFDVLDRKKKKSIESTLRLLAHNNIKLVLAGLPNNFNRFLSSQDATFVFKKLHIANCVQGSNAKEVLKSYEGCEKGSVMLGLKVNEYLFFDGEHYNIGRTKYNEAYDTKKGNKNLFEVKK